MKRRAMQFTEGAYFVEAGCDLSREFISNSIRGPYKQIGTIKVEFKNTVKELY